MSTYRNKINQVVFRMLTVRNLSYNHNLFFLHKERHSH